MISTLNDISETQPNHHNPVESLTYLDNHHFQETLEQAHGHFRANAFNADVFGKFTFIPCDHNWIPFLEKNTCGAERRVNFADSRQMKIPRTNLNQKQFTRL